MTRSQPRHSKRSKSRPAAAVPLASMATPQMGQCFGRGGRDVFKRDPTCCRPTSLRRASKTNNRIHVGRRSLIQIKPASDSEPARSCGDPELNSTLHLAVSQGAQPFRGAGASLSAPHAPLIALRAIGGASRGKVVGVKNNR
jgi:hypothetical protein